MSAFEVGCDVWQQAGDVCVSHFESIICSRSCAFLHNSSAGMKLFPTFMNSAAILLLRRKPAARLFSPCRTQASTAAVWTQTFLLFTKVHFSNICRKYISIEDSRHLSLSYELCVSTNCRKKYLGITMRGEIPWSFDITQ